MPKPIWHSSLMTAAQAKPLIVPLAGKMDAPLWELVGVALNSTANSGCVTGNIDA